MSLTLHAYYPDHQNRRVEYVAAFLTHLVNWELADFNLEAATRAPAPRLRTPCSRSTK